MRGYAMCRFQDEYILYGKLMSHQNKVKKAIDICKEALKESKNAALSFSSGKDSVVLLDIAVKAGFAGQLIFFKYGISFDIETPKENLALLKYYAEKYKLKYTIIECLGEVDCWEEIGEFILYPRTAEEKKTFDKTNNDFRCKANDFAVKNNIDLQFIGLRKDESKRRKIILSKKGPIYSAKSRTSRTCCPLLNFSNDDIWAYIFRNKLRYLSIYDYPYIDRRVIRNEITMLYSDSAALVRNGMMWHYAQMYPDFFCFLRVRYGDIGI